MIEEGYWLWAMGYGQSSAGVDHSNGRWFGVERYN